MVEASTMQSSVPVVGLDVGLDVEYCASTEDFDADVDCGENHPVIYNSFDALKNFHNSGRMLFHEYATPAQTGRGRGKKRPAVAFNCDTFEKEAKKHYLDNMIKDKYYKEKALEDGVTATMSASVQQVIQIRNVATFREVQFMYCPNKVHFISVCNSDQRTTMLHRGYVDVQCDHFTTPGTEQLPQAYEDPNPSPAAVSETGVPVITTLPDMRDLNNGAMHLLHREKDETYAEALVHSFEDKVVVKNIVYSPYRLWTEKLRKDAGMRTGSSMWLKRCKAYWMVKQILRGNYTSANYPTRPMSPQAVKEKFTELEKLATDHKEALKRDWPFSIPDTSSWAQLALHACEQED